MGSSLHLRSGTVAAVGLVTTARVVGWEPTWRAFGVTPLYPPFADMRVINACPAHFWSGVDAYAPGACNGANFNIPPTWLWLGFLGVDESDASWLSVHARHQTGRPRHVGSIFRKALE